jgi:hypothetical protein
MALLRQVNFMPKHVTATELKALIQTRMNALDELEEDGEQVFAHDVTWQEPDDSGCNWVMKGYRGPRNYATIIQITVDKLRREYRLREDLSQWI